MRYLTDRDMEVEEYLHLQSEIYRRPVYQFVRTKTEALLALSFEKEHLHQSRYRESGNSTLGTR